MTMTELLSLLGTVWLDFLTIKACSHMRMLDSVIIHLLPSTVVGHLLPATTTTHAVPALQIRATGTIFAFQWFGSTADESFYRRRSASPRSVSAAAPPYDPNYSSNGYPPGGNGIPNPSMRPPPGSRDYPPPRGNDAGYRRS